MKTKMAIVSVIITLLAFQSSFAWSLRYAYRVWGEDCIILRVPVTPMPVPIVLPDLAMPHYQFERYADNPENSGIFARKSLRFRTLSR